MRIFYKIAADEPSVLDMFNSMCNTEYIVDNMVVMFDSDVILSFNGLHKLYQEITIFNENCEYGKVYLEEL